MIVGMGTVVLLLASMCRSGQESLEPANERSEIRSRVVHAVHHKGKS